LFFCLDRSTPNCLFFSNQPQATFVPQEIRTHVVFMQHHLAAAQTPSDAEERAIHVPTYEIRWCRHTARDAPGVTRFIRYFSSEEVRQIVQRMEQSVAKSPS